MDELVQHVLVLKKSPVHKIIAKRLREFKVLSKKPSTEQFKELCFCLLTANYNAEKGIKIQRAIGDGFCFFSQKKLSNKLRELGYRYPNRRAEFIWEAQRFSDCIKEKINSFKNGKKARDWLVENVRGLGFKEASHFLRNTGFTDVAIIDFHIVDLLCKYSLLIKPKTLSKKKYLEIEILLEELAEKTGLNLAELDLYLWFIETGKVLK